MEIKYDGTFNYSYYDESGFSLLSFPYPSEANKCPRPYNFSIRLKDGQIMHWENALGVWRKVPTYLSQEYGGHLVVFFENHEDISAKLLDCVAVTVATAGDQILGHELCDFKYNIS